MYSEYLLNSGFNAQLPEYLRSTPTNTLFNEVKRVYRFIDPSSFISEISRDYYYASNLESIAGILRVSTPITSFNSFLNNIFYYTLDNNLHYSSRFDNTSTKDQYRPMKKGISNMVRLHATGAVAMPTEVRVHILASSKDIIHSWAIPSAGIKIDCIPGYSSHRVAIFLTSGIF